MSDSDKPDTQALILKQLKSIKIALCLVVVMMLLLSGLIVVGGVVAGIAVSGGFDQKTIEEGVRMDYSTGEAVRIRYNEVHVEDMQIQPQENSATE